MRPRSAVTLGALLVLAATVVAMPTSALAKSARARANSQTFTDSTGEDPNAPDITTIALSNDDAGLVTFKINISNRPALTADMQRMYCATVKLVVLLVEMPSEVSSSSIW